MSFSKDAEITLEANPDSAGDWRALRTLPGQVSTVFPWAYVLHRRELRAVGRIHTFEQVRAAVDAVRKAKFKT